MGHGVGLTVTLRVRVSPQDAHYTGELCDGSRILSLFGDVATELLIRLDGDEGTFRAYEGVEFLAPVRAGDYLEATGVITQVGATSRAMAFEARKVIAGTRSADAAGSAADALADPIIVCRALGTCVVPAERQRRPRLVLPALTGAPPDHASLPEPRPVITPPPRVIVTPPTSALILTAALRLDASATARDVADEAARCREAGAVVVHLDDRGVPSRDFLAAAVTALREATDLIVQVSTRAAPGMGVDERAQALRCQPDLATLSCGTHNVGDEIREDPRPIIRALAGRIRAARGLTVLECSEVGHIDEALALLREGHIDEPLHFQFLLGTPGGIGAREDVLRFMISQIPAGATWGATAVGEHQRATTEMAMRLGGHARVGPEDGDPAPRAAGSLPAGARPESSAARVARAVEYARALGREIVDPGRARQLLGIAPLA